MVAKTLMTAAELELVPDDGYQYELIDGELIRMAPSMPDHSAIGALFTGYLVAHVVPRRIGGARCSRRSLGISATAWRWSSSSGRPRER